MLHFILADGYLRRAVPNMVPRKDAKGHRWETMDGYKPEGIPVARIIKDKDDVLIQSLRAAGHIVIV